MKPYTFDPLQFGFEPLSKFPELIAAGAQNWLGPKCNIFIKVLTIGGEKLFGRKVFWYTICNLTNALSDDDRVTFYSHSFDETRELANFSDIQYPRQVYIGLVSNDEFATQLLSHLFGTLKNGSVGVEGKNRLEQNLNEELRKIWSEVKA